MSSNESNNRTFVPFLTKTYRTNEEELYDLSKMENFSKEIYSWLIQSVDINQWGEALILLSLEVAEHYGALSNREIKIALLNEIIDCAEEQKTKLLQETSEG